MEDWGIMRRYSRMAGLKEERFVKVGKKRTKTLSEKRMLGKTQYKKQYSRGLAKKRKEIERCKKKTKNGVYYGRKGHSETIRWNSKLKGRQKTTLKNTQYTQETKSEQIKDIHN